MKWFEGSIPDAINLSKQRRSLFIVYVYGPDEMSQKMNTTVESSDIEELLESYGAVALKLQNASQECTFFSQIYPVVLVPSIFCIGEGGVPLEVIGGYVTAEECLKKLKDAQQKLSGGNVPSAQQASPENTQSSGTSQDVEMPPAEEGATGGGDPSTSLDEKVERAKVLLEKKKEEKAAEEFEKQHNSEIERRKLGQDLQKLKQTQQEMQMKELKDQMKRDKEEERKAKEKIKAQIARDREERATRYKKEKEERDRSVDEAKKAKLVEQQRLAAEQEAQRSETARIQVRLPDGSSVTQNFDATDTFQSLQDFVGQRVGGNVSISTTYPKHTFTDEDSNKTFRELQLAPSAVVLALPSRRGRTMGAGSSSSTSTEVSSGGFFSIILSPLLMLWRFFYTLLFGSGGNTQAPGGTQQSSQTGDRSQSSTSTNRPTTAYKRRTGPTRLADVRDDDDDMSTYNGNSTQQL